MSDRINKINKLIKQEVSKIIEKEFGPEIGFLTVTDVRTTNDLRLADVFVSVYGDDKGIKETLKKITPTVQQILNKRLKIKYVPRIIFRIDNSTDYAFEIEKTLKAIKSENK
jgi:ribosome-binding factor A